METIYYCVLKNYKGLFRKKHRGNTHLFLAPISPDTYVYLGLLGELTDEPGTYATHLIVKLPKDLVDTILTGEQEYFKDRFVIVETLPCSPKKIDSGEYSLKMGKKGKYILSPIDLKYEVEYSTSSRRVFLMKGVFNFESNDIKLDVTMKMAAAKQDALMGDKERFSEALKIYKNNKR